MEDGDFTRTQHASQPATRFFVDVTLIDTLPAVDPSTNPSGKDLVIVHWPSATVLNDKPAFVTSSKPLPGPSFSFLAIASQRFYAPNVGS